MADVLLKIGDHLTRIGLVPAPIEVLGHDPELDDQIAGQILRLDLAALFPPKPEQRLLIVAHDNAGIRAADEVTAITRFKPPTHATLRALSISELENRRRKGCYAGDMPGVCGSGSICGRFGFRACRERANYASNVFSPGHGLPPWLGLGPGRSTTSCSARHFSITDNRYAVNS